MTANQVQAQLLEEIDALSLAQRLLLLDLIRSFRSTLKPAASARRLGPMKLHLSPAAPESTFRREEIYGDDGR